MKHENAIKAMQSDVTDFLQKQIEKEGYGIGYFKHYISEQTGIPEDILTVILKQLKYAGRIKLIQVVDQFSIPSGSGYCLTDELDQ